MPSSNQPKDKRRFSTPKSLDRVLKDGMKELNLEQQIKKFSVFSVWDELVGTQIALRSKPEAIYQNVLHVVVSDHTWMQQISLHKHKILAKIKVTFGPNVIEDIYFRLGKPEKEAIEERKPSPPLKLDHIHLSKETLLQIEADIASIQDKELRDALRDVMIKDAKLKQYRKQEDHGKH